MTDRATADDVALAKLTRGARGDNWRWRASEHAVAVLRLAAREAELARALEFYADTENWISKTATADTTAAVRVGRIRFDAPIGQGLPAALCDHGDQARDALAGKPLGESTLEKF